MIKGAVPEIGSLLSVAVQVVFVFGVVVCAAYFVYSSPTTSNELDELELSNGIGYIVGRFVFREY